MILITFYLNASLYVFANNNTASHTAIAAGGFNPHPLKEGNLSSIIFCIAQFFDVIFLPNF
jgi:hypothetical protein